MGAAPICRRLRLVIAAATAGLGLLSGVGTASAALPSTPLWGVELHAASAPTAAALAALREQGVSVIVLDSSKGRPAALDRRAATARHAGLRVAIPRVLGSRSLAGLCRVERRGPARSCAVWASSPRQAVALARRNVADIVAYRLSSLAQLRFLQGVNAKTHILAVSRTVQRLDRQAWSRAVARAGRDATLDLAASVASPKGPALSGYLALIRPFVPGKTAAAAKDNKAPTSPGAITVTSSSATSIGLAWGASRDNVGVVGYHVFRGGTFVGNAATPQLTVADLSCDTTYEFAVEAYDAAGNRSRRTSKSAATSVCGSGGGGGGDALPPSAPLGLATTAATQTSITITWIASSDNVAVAGYGVYRGAGAAGSTVQTTYTVSGLACGTTYSLAVDAYDAAGNRSSKATLSTITSPCASGGDTVAPTAPTALVKTGGSTTLISIAWNASSDNVGVAGYGVYRGTTLQTSVSSTSATIAGLACSTSYTLAVDAYDASGNRSARTSINASTAACPPPPPADTQAPTAPTGLTVDTIAQTSISISWTASTDDVGVAGYGRYVGSARLSDATGTSHTFTGLACGTSYSVGVDAFDAAGNRSTRTSATASTSACSPPPSGTAQVYLSPSGSDTNACTQVAPCRSFDRAYRVAAPGAVVEVASGSYGSQSINADASKTSSTDVLFRPAAGASVSVGSMQMRGAHLELRDMTIATVNYANEANDVTLRNVVNHGMWWVGSSNISIIGGEITCPSCASHPHMQNAGSSPPRNILFDGVYFHDWHSQAGEHVECLQILGGDGITIRNSTFKNCGTRNNGYGATAALHLQAYGSPILKNVLLENNFFYPSGNMYVIQGEDFENFDLRYNSLSGPILLYNGPSAGTGMDFVGNVMKASPCNAQNNTAPINWRYNVIQGGRCGSTDRNAASGFIDPNSNLHLNPGAAAINAGDPDSYPNRDIDGQRRPTGSAPDAGADERR